MHRNPPILPPWMKWPWMKWRKVKIPFNLALYHRGRRGTQRSIYLFWEWGVWQDVHFYHLYVGSPKKCVQFGIVAITLLLWTETWVSFCCPHKALFHVVPFICTKYTLTPPPLTQIGSAKVPLHSEADGLSFKRNRWNHITLLSYHISH